MKGKLYFAVLGLVLLFLTITVLTFNTSAGESPASRLANALGAPAVLSYQGVLADSAGNPVDGEYTMRFALYPDAESATALWSETQTVPVVEGLFDVYLGDITPLAADIFTQEIYLGVKVGADAEMTPRLRIATAPYAFTAYQLPCTTTAWYRDADADGYGNPSDSVSACQKPAGYVSDDQDCDDSHAQIHPGAVELCNGIDDDCTVSTADGVGDVVGQPCDGPDTDLCAEGTYWCAAATIGCSDVTDNLVELCNGIDDDCNPATADGAGDVVGQPCDGPDTDLCLEGTYWCAAATIGCSDLTDNLPELCNGTDDDCDGITDEDAQCDDGIACTTDTCGLMGCLNTPDNAACDDGNECTNDLCGVAGCGSANVSNGTPCTNGTCFNGVCTTTP